MGDQQRRTAVVSGEQSDVRDSRELAGDRPIRVEGQEHRTGDVAHDEVPGIGVPDPHEQVAGGDGPNGVTGCVEEHELLLPVDQGPDRDGERAHHARRDVDVEIGDRLAHRLRCL